MSSPTTAPPTHDPVGRRRPLNGALALRPRGLWLVTSLELRQRLRSARWYVALGVWTLALLFIGALGLAPTLYSSQWDQLEPVAAVVFSLQIILVLFAMLLVVPALSAGSINGDRTAGTLATLQASLLSPAEIVLGKLLAGFLTGLAFLVLALPSVVPIAVLGGVGPLYFLRVVLVIVLLTLCVTAVGLGLSALTQRQLGSVVLAYVLVFGLTAVLPVTWGVSAVFLQQEREVVSYHATYSTDGAPETCEQHMGTQRVPRVDLTLPLMWGNPVVLLAEAAPALPQDYWRDDGENPDALRMIKAGMRSAAAIAHPATSNYCEPGLAGYPQQLGDPPNRPIWPMGLALWLLGGTGATAVALQRLRIPVRRLGKGTRIA
ncbi:ABC transporter permease [Brachybacterium saurashtrense]|uniref:ABC transporter permease n=1 Tax=Brachybacterium saurashtrense TaxID=556288 RepID=A0A345YQN7_9MICO|nr:ABC transporter permease subunit [Brachybacterium saurashtrense]AXK46239.1 ABC transporter permease [Brachybacterium saurashtrense]RRR23979.1 ABC transporter permease [Brachybacterium saurashtrense]